jgi:hypothetical protein
LFIAGLGYTTYLKLIYVIASRWHFPRGLFPSKSFLFHKQSSYTCVSSFLHPFLFSPSCPGLSIIKHFSWNCIPTLSCLAVFTLPVGHWKAKLFHRTEISVFMVLFVTEGDFSYIYVSIGSVLDKQESKWNYPQNLAPLSPPEPRGIKFHFIFF